MNQLHRIEFKSIDFEDMLFPVHDVSERNFCLEEKGFRRLNDYEEFTSDIEGFSDIEKDQVVRYICYMYDINSPLLTISVLERKGYASKFSGFKLNDKKEVSDKIMSMMQGYNEHVNRMIIKFCMLFNLIKYTKLIGLVEAYEKLMVKFISGEYNSGVLSSIDNLEIKISKLVTDIFSGDDTKELSRIIYLLADEGRLELSPEFQALRIMEGKNSVSINPYKLRSYV